MKHACQLKQKYGKGVKAPSLQPFVSKTIAEPESWKLGQQKLFKHIIPRELNSEVCKAFQQKKHFF